MQRLEVATDVFADPQDVYDLLLRFTGYADYSEHLEEVVRHGDGAPGTEYDIAVSWWRLSHTVRSKVTDVDPPNAIYWELVSDLTAQGSWRIESVTETIGDVELPDGDVPVTRVRLLVEYDSGSVDADTLGLSGLVPIGLVVDKATPKIREEATKVVERVVEDLEGEPRAVELAIDRSE